MLRNPIVAACAITALSSLLLGASCKSNPTPPPPVIATNPVCVMQATVFTDNPKADTVMASVRNSTNVEYGFETFSLPRMPRGNPSPGAPNDIYGFAEAWMRTPLGPIVVRGQAHPGRRAAFNDFGGSAWTIAFQDNRATWSGSLGSSTISRGNETDRSEDGALLTPQLMPVGVANPQMFACAGARSMDEAVRTISLFEVFPPSASGGGRVRLVQDLLNGDDRFARTTDPLSPQAPPTPTIHNSPGSPPHDGFALCAMTQLDDDDATRELHMLMISDNRLFHAMANNWSDATSDSGGTFKRFNTVTQWAEVTSVLGGSFGKVVSAAMVGRPRSINVLFMAQHGNLHKLWHTVRFSPSGAWRAADDVLALNFGNVNGVPEEFQIALGNCPVYGPEAIGAAPGQTELVYALYQPKLETSLLGRIVTAPIEWVPGVLTGIYSPLQTFRVPRASNPARNIRLGRIVISERPFPDFATPPP
jgi:hypothetical protein